MYFFFSLAQVAKIMLAVAIFITHPLQMYVSIDIIWTEYLSGHFEKSRFKIFYEYSVRTGLVLVTCKSKNCNLFCNNFIICSCSGCCHSAIGPLHLIIWGFLFIYAGLSFSGNHRNLHFLVYFDRNAGLFNHF